jgi:homoserine kinase
VRVFIGVPATVANLGPGFDILALALQLQNDVHAEQNGNDGLTVDAGEGAPVELNDPDRNLVTRAYARTCQALGRPSTGVHFRCVNRIPIARGIGSSAAATLAGVLAAVALHRAPWGEEAILDTAAAMEGHRDNAAAALLGGLAICVPQARTTRMDAPEELHAVLFLPAARLHTEQSRGVVPRTFAREDAVFNAARCALLVRCLAMRDYAALADAMDDRWHQPARTALVPALPRLIAAARRAGAAGASLAGGGPSVLALTPLDPAPVEAALRAEAEATGIAGSTLVAGVRNWGTRVDLHQ